MDSLNRGSPPGRIYLFAYRQSSGELSRRLGLTGGAAHYPPLQLSPDGRWLILDTFDADRTQRTLYLHQVDGQETMTYPLAREAQDELAWPFDWSADGRWLAQISDGYLRLLLPDYHYEYRLYHSLGKCTSVVWLDAW